MMILFCGILAINFQAIELSMESMKTMDSMFHVWQSPRWHVQGGFQTNIYIYIYIHIVFIQLLGCGVIMHHQNTHTQLEGSYNKNLVGSYNKNLESSYNNVCCGVYFCCFLINSVNASAW